MQKASGLPAIADDSGLMVDALNGEPGVYSARFGGKITDRERIELLLSRLDGVPAEKRTARFVSVIACCLPDGRVVTARGVCEGVISDTPHGTGGFGYDPVFYIPALNKTFGELTPTEKHRISHRGNALRAFAEAFRKEAR